MPPKTTGRRIAVRALARRMDEYPLNDVTVDKLARAFQKHGVELNLSAARELRGHIGGYNVIVASFLEKYDIAKDRWDRVVITWLTSPFGTTCDVRDVVDDLVPARLAPEVSRSEFEKIVYYAYHHERDGQIRAHPDGTITLFKHGNATQSSVRLKLHGSTSILEQVGTVLLMIVIAIVAFLFIYAH
jgi:hypothetical protein